MRNASRRSHDMEESRAIAPFTRSTQLEERADQYAAALPSTIKPERFSAPFSPLSPNSRSSSMSARIFPPHLHEVRPGRARSNGREAAFVVFRDKICGKVAQYLAMVGGIRKMVLQPARSPCSSSIASRAGRIDVRLGSNAHIDRRPYLKGHCGPLVVVYSIAMMKGGYKSFEVGHRGRRRCVRFRGPRTRAVEILADEMAKKTVAKRHAEMMHFKRARSRTTTTSLGVLHPGAARATMHARSTVLPMARCGGDGLHGARRRDRRWHDQGLPACGDRGR